MASEEQCNNDQERVKRRTMRGLMTLDDKHLLAAIENGADALLVLELQSDPHPKVIRVVREVHRISGNVLDRYDQSSESSAVKGEVENVDGRGQASED